MLIAIAIVSVACSVNSAPSTHTNEARTIRFAWKAGYAQNYRVSIAIASSNTTLSESTEDAMRVVSVGQDGSARVEVDDLSNGLTGRPVPPYIITFGSDGLMQKIDPEEAGYAPLPGSAYPIFPILPDSSVRTGDTWRKSVSVATSLADSGAMVESTLNRYLRRETVKGKPLDVIENEIDGALDLTVDYSKVPFEALPSAGYAHALVHYHGTVHYKITYWFDSSAHRVTRSTGTNDTNLSVDITLKNTGAQGTEPLTETIRTDIVWL